MAYIFWLGMFFLLMHAIFVDYHRSIAYIISWAITFALLKGGYLFYITGCGG